MQYVPIFNQKEGRNGAAKIVGEHAVNNGANLGYEIAFFDAAGNELSRLLVCIPYKASAARSPLHALARCELTFEQPPPSNAFAVGLRRLPCRVRGAHQEPNQGEGRRGAAALSSEGIALSFFTNNLVFYSNEERERLLVLLLK